MKDRQALPDRNIRDLWDRGKFWEIFGFSSGNFTTLELAKQYSALTRTYHDSLEDKRMIDDAFATLKAKNRITQCPLLDYLAAISVGKVCGEVRLDLAYDEDSQADVDMNLVMTGNGRMVEVQGTAEQAPFSKQDLDEFLALGWSGIQDLIKIQKDLVGSLT